MKQGNELTRADIEKLAHDLAALLDNPAVRDGVIGVDHATVGRNPISIHMRRESMEKVFPYTPWVDMECGGRERHRFVNTPNGSVLVVALGPREAE